MKPQNNRRCPNCGTVLSDAALVPCDASATTLEYVCPTCQLRVSPRASEPAQVTLGDLEAQLFTLVDQGLESTQSPDQLAHVLGDLLSYVTEYAHPDHHFSVELVDLGVTDEARDREEVPEISESLPQRYDENSTKWRPGHFSGKVRSTIWASRFIHLLMWPTLVWHSNATVRMR